MTERKVQIEALLDEPYEPNTVVGDFEVTVNGETRTVPMTLGGLIDYVIRALADDIEAEGGQVTALYGLGGPIEPTHREVRWGR